MYEFLRNLYISIFKKDELKRAKKELDSWQHVIQSEGIHGLRKFMSKFKYKKEDHDWTPDGPEYVVMAGWRDDCDGAAVLGRWGFKQLGIWSQFVRLKGATNHRICITESRKWFTSNSNVVEVPDPAKWQEYVLTWGWHKQKGYTRIEVL